MRRLGLVLLPPLLAWPAAAQPLRTMVIEPGDAVAVPPRGAPMAVTRQARLPNAFAYPPLPPMYPPGQGLALAPLGVAAGAVAPAIGLAALAATALLGSGGGSVPGGGGGTAAPSRTR